MIPKKLHYCWFGDKEFSPLHKACIQSWKEVLPEYEVFFWNEKNIPTNDFIDHHLKLGNWAFVSDFVRLYAIYTHGGIYLDTDFEVIKPLDHLLDSSGFIAYESVKRINTGICAGEKGHAFYHDCMDYMQTRHKKNLTYEIAPVVATTVYQKREYDIQVYPSEYFYPYNPYAKENEVKILMHSMIKPETVAIHHWAKGWSGEPKLRGFKKYKNSIKKRFFR